MFPLAVSLLGVIVVVVWRGLPCAESVYPFFPLSSLLFSSLLFSYLHCLRFSLYSQWKNDGKFESANRHNW